ncbi:uncharacterized protein SCODWIG_00627 [Saccharomycodes ludwigii]|uniref:Uncharacterized protein n=1 Tax=Saccharomycodes ludwigii TaxID=36035 RepID=A0A376B2G1_9ASCO|nr:uncharacterized protein SCODWIG_00627 [Saccharomycodes ludwigii]
MLVPRLIQIIFNRFPLKEYGPQQEVDINLVNKIEQHRYRLIPKTNFDNKAINANEAKCEIGCYKVFKYTVAGNKNGVESVFLPNDPICLYLLLQFCYKNNLNLATDDKNIDFSTNNNFLRFSLVELSYHASTEKQLPIMIEQFESNDNTSVTFIREYNSIKDILSNKELSTCKEKNDIFLMELLDIVLYDFFITLNCVNNDGLLVKNYVYDDNKSFNNLNLLKDSLMRRNNYYLRNGSNNTDIGCLIVNIKEVLLQFEEYMVKRNINNDGDDLNIEMKLSSYIITLLYSLEIIISNEKQSEQFIELDKFIRFECPNLVELCNKVILSFMD